jgi:hypothetical protein
MAKSAVPTGNDSYCVARVVAKVGPKAKRWEKSRFIRWLIGIVSQMKQLSGGGYSSK